MKDLDWVLGSWLWASPCWVVGFWGEGESVKVRSLCLCVSSNKQSRECMPFVKNILQQMFQTAMSSAKRTFHRRLLDTLDFIDHVSFPHIVVWYWIANFIWFILMNGIKFYQGDGQFRHLRGNFTISWLKVLGKWASPMWHMCFQNCQWLIFNQPCLGPSLRIPSATYVLLFFKSRPHQSHIFKKISLSQILQDWNGRYPNRTNFITTCCHPCIKIGYPYKQVIYAN